MTLSSGTRLGPYEVLAPLGAGGMGEVYRGKDSRLGREVAIKVLPEHLARDPAALARFEREAKAVAAQSHPNILAIHDFGTEQGVSFAVTELLEGETLRSRLARSPLPWRKALEIGVSIADGLSAAHAKGIIHRDLKPENIFLTSDGRVKILDFGLARLKPLDSSQTMALAETTPVETQPGTVLGTVGYMSPEQVRGESADAPSDIFSLGCVLYEMVAGQRAFARPTAAETMTAILKEEPLELAGSGKVVPPALERVIGHSLEKNPQERFQSARDLAFALRALASDSGISKSALALAAPRFRPAAWVTATGLAGALLMAFFVGWVVARWHGPRRAYWKLPAAPPRQVLRQAGFVDHAALAPDGTKLAYVLENELYLQEIGGGEPRKLTSDGFPKLFPRFSPDGNRLLFAHRTPDEQNSALYVLDLPAGMPQLLIEDASRGIWSPDGNKLAFVRFSTNEAFVADAAGKQPRSLGPAKNGCNECLGVSWTPDGKKLAVLNRGKIHIVSADGQVRKELPRSYPGIDRVGDVVFTPDADFLIASVAFAGTVQILQIPVRGGPFVPFSMTSEHKYGMTISRDGKKLLAVHVRSEFHVVVAEPGREAAPDRFRQISFGRWEVYPALSPDEKKVAYVGWPVGDLWVLNADGTDARKLAVRAGLPGGANSLAWSPDGKTLAFFTSTENPEIWSLRLDEGTPRQLSTLKGGQKTFPSFTGDGKNIVFGIARNGKNDIWLAPAEGGEGKALTTDGLSQMPRAAPLGSAVAYLRETPASTFEVRVLDYVAARDVVVVTVEALSKFGKFHAHPPRWSSDAKYLFLATESGLVRVSVAGGHLEKFSFPISGGGMVPCFDVFSDYRKIIFDRESNSAEPWLYSDLQ